MPILNLLYTSYHNFPPKCNWKFYRFFGDSGNKFVEIQGMFTERRSDLCYNKLQEEKYAFGNGRMSSIQIVGGVIFRIAGGIILLDKLE